MRALTWLILALVVPGARGQLPIGRPGAAPEKNGREPIVRAVSGQRSASLSGGDPLALRDLRSALLSPDGSTIACTVATPDLASNQAVSEVWLIPVATGSARKVAL